MSFILADTSVWLDHLRTADAQLDQLAESRRLMMHSFVIGELSLGNVHDRPVFLQRLKQMMPVTLAEDDEVHSLIEINSLFGSGIGWVDAHLLASVLLTDDVKLWTRDRRLNAAAERLGCAARLHH